MGEHINVGIGTSDSDDARAAVEEAVTAAREEMDGGPKFSIVYCSASYDAEAIAGTAEEMLGDSDWVGISTDANFVNSDYIGDGVSVLCLESDYMHFGISVAEAYREAPKQKAKKAAEDAMGEVEIDEYVDAYVQFKRTQQSEYDEIVRTPPYFMLVFPSGTIMREGEHLPGRELEVVEGIVSQTGPHIPLFGGSASSDLDRMVEEHRADNFQMVNGEVYDEAAVLVFVACNLYFTNRVMHGYERSDKFVTVTELSEDGHTIQELNGEEPVQKYADLLGVEKDELLDNPVEHCLRHPFALLDFSGRELVREALPNEDGETLQANFAIPEGASLNVLDFDREMTINTVPTLMEEQGEEASPAVSLVCECSGRKPLVEDIYEKEQDELGGEFPLFGFYSFGEIGSYGSQSPQVHSQTVTSLAIYDKILAEM